MVQDTCLEPARSAYSIIVNTGIKKSKLVWHNAILSGFMAGVFVGLAAHTASRAGGLTPEDGPIPQVLVYMLLFPVGLIGVVWTSAELYTSNTMTLLVALLHCRIKWYHLVLNWVSSFFSNAAGVLFVACFISWLGGTFEKEPLLTYIRHNAEYKGELPIHQVFLRAIGCNIMVCMAVFTTCACADTAGKVLVIWFWIVGFGVAGFEHIVANMYTIPVGMMYGADVSWYGLFVSNLLFTWMGNTIAGVLFVGIVYWWQHKDYYEETYPNVNKPMTKVEIVVDSETHPHTPTHSANNDQGDSYEQNVNGEYHDIQ